MDTFLKIFFYATSTLALLALGWYTEHAIWEEFSYFYQVLRITIFLLLTAIIVLAVFRPFNSHGQFKFFFSLLMVGSLIFFSGTHLYQADLPGVNRILKLSVHDFRQNFFGHTILKIKRLVESRDAPSKVVTVTTTAQMEVQFFDSFDSKVLAKFGTRPAFIATNLPGEESRVFSLDRSDRDLSMRPFAFPDQNTVLSFSESLEVGGDMLGQSLSLHQLDDSEEEYNLIWEK